MSADHPCCVCGDWFSRSALVLFDDSALHADVRRRSISGTLKEKYLCKECRSRCATCQALITHLQRRLHPEAPGSKRGLCLRCCPTPKPCRSKGAARPAR